MQFERSVRIVIIPAFVGAWFVGFAVGDAAIVFGCGTLADDGRVAFIATPIWTSFFEDVLKVSAKHFGISVGLIELIAVTAVDVGAADKTTIVDDPLSPTRLDG